MYYVAFGYVTILRKKFIVREYSRNFSNFITMLNQLFFIDLFI